MNKGDTFTGSAMQIVALVSQEAAENPDVLYDLCIHREKRSLDANSFFHVLCDKLRQKLGISMARCKNHLIADYGQILYLEDGVPMIYKTNAPPEYTMELEEPHLLLVKTSVEKDKEVYFYRVYRGSHTYSGKEMYQLIQGTVAECEEQGIETATPSEIAHMQELWERKYGKTRTNESL